MSRIFRENILIHNFLAISNHASMLGGGEYSFLDLLVHLPCQWRPIAAVPDEGELEALLMEENLETHKCPLPPIRPWNLMKIPATLVACIRLCRNHRVALIYANGSRASFYGGIVGRLLSIPVIWHCRIADPDPYLDFFLASLSNCIVTNSRATARRFQARIRPKVRVVYNGVDISWLQSESLRKPEMIQDDWKVILVVARVSRWKRHDLALSAFENVARSEWDYLQEKTHLSQFSERVHWMGQIEDVRPWYRAAELLVLPSENEPFGRVLVEAMASGVPVVATRSGGVPEVVRHNRDGILVASGSVQELTEAMQELLENDQLRRRVGKSGQERSKAFSLEAHVDQMVQVFKEAKPNKSL